MSAGRGTSARIWPWCAASAVLVALATWPDVLPVAAQPPVRPFRESMAIAVDAEAAKRLQILADRWAAGQWDQLVESLVELCETRGEGVVTLEAGTPGGTARYGLVHAACEQMIAALPPEGLAAYRRRIDPLAERWFQAATMAGDRLALRRLVRQAYYSSWGDEALWWLGQAAWDEGDFAAAERWWSQLLPADLAGNSRRYPDPSQPPADVAARCLLCRIFQGNREGAEAELSRFIERFGQSTGVLAGVERPWREHLEMVLSESGQWATMVRRDDVPTYAGSPERNFISPRAIDVGSELWSAPLKPVRLPETPRTTVFPTASPLVYHPVVVEGRVFLSDGGRIQAWNLSDGQPVWGDSATIYPQVDDEVPLLLTRSVFGSPCWTVTVESGRLYARMGSAVTNPSSKEFRDLPNELVCLDVGAGQGRLLWKLSGEEFTQLLQESAEAAMWCWEGAPLASDGRIYAALSRRRQQLEWSVACLDGETGTLLWHRPVGVTRTTPPENENRASQLLLTLGDGRLYLSTDWGAIVALDAAEGQWEWAVTYESLPLSWPPAVAAPRIAPAPCIYADGRLYAAPLDAQRVFCFDASSGELRWQRAVFEPLTHLLGVARGRLIASGNSLWAFHAQTGQIDWSVRQVEPEDFGHGRGWLAGECIYWPTRRALLVVAQQSGHVLREHPLALPHRPRTGGNVVISQNALVIASGDRLSVYGEFAGPHPTDPRRLSQRTSTLPTISLRADVSAPALEASRQPPAADSTVPVVRPDDRDAPPSSTSATTGYWRRAWHRFLTDRARCLLPAGSAPVSEHAVVLHQAEHLQAWDRHSGQLRWQLPLEDPLVWSGYGSRWLLVATTRELCAVAPASGSIEWRGTWPDLFGEGLPPAMGARRSVGAFTSTPHGLIVLVPEWGLIGVDEIRGTVTWRYLPAARNWQSIVNRDSGQLLVLERFDADRARVWSFSTGGLAPSTPPVFRGFRRAQPAGPHGWVIETDDRRLEWWSPRLEPRAEYVGPLSTAHADPWVVHRGDHWALVNDGVSVIGLKGDHSGRIWPGWTQALARGPLTHPEQQAACDEHCLYTAAAGTLRAIDLATGRIAWERRLPDAGAQRVQLVSSASANLGGLIVVPWETAATVSDIPLFDCATGQPLQRIRLHEPAADLAVHVDPAGLLMATSREILALAPRER
uniref:Pyrrolo-quinoline quinone repeat domain-containing protein n=1 Tax=Schlesneria paludicola TaxID=360056 RepID=A0A7C4QSG0_9PLAN